MTEEYIFSIVLKEAMKANKKNEIPVGAVIVRNNKIIAKSHNDRQKKHNILGHAEVNVILKAEKKLKDWRLDDCIMYVSLYPCEMCQKIITESRISKVIYLLDKKEAKHISSNYIQTKVCNDINSKYEKIVKKFFKELRNN